MASNEPSQQRRAGRLASGGAIRDAAARVFLEKGYAGTSMGEIAAAAKVSKQTIYTHFASKEELFADLVLGNAERVDEFTAGLATTLNDRGGIEAALRKLARQYLKFVARPEAVRLRRLIIGEASRFPDLARRYYELVPGRVYSALADELKNLDRRRVLRIDDPVIAAQQFAWLTLGMPLDRGMFFPVESAFRGLKLDEIADGAVRVFVAAHHR